MNAWPFLTAVRGHKNDVAHVLIVLRLFTLHFVFITAVRGHKKYVSRNKDKSHAAKSRSVLKSLSISLNDDACWHFRGSLEHRKHHARTMHSSRERAHAHRHVQIHNMLIHYKLVCSCLLRCVFAIDIVNSPQLGFSKEF